MAIFWGLALIGSGAAAALQQAGIICLPIPAGGLVESERAQYHGGGA